MLKDYGIKYNMIYNMISILEFTRELLKYNITIYRYILLF